MDEVTPSPLHPSMEAEPISVRLTVTFRLQSAVSGLPAFSVRHTYGPFPIAAESLRAAAQGITAPLKGILHAACHHTIVNGVARGGAPLAENAALFLAASPAWMAELEVQSGSNWRAASLGRISELPSEALIQSTAASESDYALFTLVLTGRAPDALFSESALSAAVSHAVQRLPLKTRLQQCGISRDTLDNAKFANEKRPLQIMVREAEAMETILQYCGLSHKRLQENASSEALENMLAAGAVERDDLLEEFGWRPSTFNTRIDWFKHARTLVRERRTWISDPRSSPRKST